MRTAWLATLTLALAVPVTLPRLAECSSFSADRVEPRGELSVDVNIFPYRDAAGQADLSEVEPMEHAIKARMEQLLRDGGLKIKEEDTTPQRLMAQLSVRPLESHGCHHFAVAAYLSLAEHVIDRGPFFSFGEESVEEDFTYTWQESTLAVADQSELERVETVELMKLTRSFLEAPGGAGRVPPRAAPLVSASGRGAQTGAPFRLFDVQLPQGAICVESREPVYGHLGVLSRVSLVVDTSGSDAAVGATLGPKYREVVARALTDHGLRVSDSEKVVVHVALTVSRFEIGVCEGYVIASELQLREPVWPEINPSGHPSGPIQASTWRRESLALSSESALNSTVNNELLPLVNQFLGKFATTSH